MSPSSAALAALSALPPSFPYRLIYSTSTNLPPRYLEDCFQLIESTSSAAYRASSKGWSPRAKKVEMREEDMRYLLLCDAESASSHSEKQEDDTVVHGFLSYMITEDDSVPVIYVYEIHLHDAARGHGAGRALMRCAEAIGEHEGMKKAMLTVFVSNTDAIRFYERLGYGKWDEEYIPPRKRLRSRETEERKASYIIMAKELGDGEWETDGEEDAGT